MCFNRERINSTVLPTNGQSHERGILINEYVFGKLELEQKKRPLLMKKATVILSIAIVVISSVSISLLR